MLKEKLVLFFLSSWSKFYHPVSPAVSILMHAELGTIRSMQDRMPLFIFGWKPSGVYKWNLQGYFKIKLLYM